MISIRPAEGSDASDLVALAAAVGGEPGGWLLTTEAWRPVADERRYLKAVRRHADAAVLVALDGDRIVGRLSLARDPHPASAHVADLGMMVAATHRAAATATTVLLLLAVAAGMVGLSFASVPLYRLFCQATGFGGTTQRAATAPARSRRRRRHGPVRRPDRPRPRLGVSAAEQPRSRCIPGRSPRCFFARSTEPLRRSPAQRPLQRDPGQGRHLFRQIAVLLLHRAALGPGEGVDMGVSSLSIPIS